MAEVRVHAAFSVKDQDLFLSEAKKMIAATQAIYRKILGQKYEIELRTKYVCDL